jgi:hypothetical protein
MKKGKGDGDGVQNREMRAVAVKNMSEKEREKKEREGGKRDGLLRERAILTKNGGERWRLALSFLFLSSPFFFLSFSLFPASCLSHWPSSFPTSGRPALRLDKISSTQDDLCLCHHPFASLKGNDVLCLISATFCHARL